MKISSLVIFIFFLYACSHSSEEKISFYQVPLTCGASHEIGCGSRIKPLFIETGKEKSIKESWVNRDGTVLAIVWDETLSTEEKEKIMNPLFKQLDIQATYVSEPEMQKKLTEKFSSALAPAQITDKWYKNMEVDQLSLEEAGILADTSTLFAVRAGLINETEAGQIKKDIEEYMKTELIKVRTLNELTSPQTDFKWKQSGYEIYVKYIGIDRAEKVRDYYIEYQKKLVKEKSCCEKDKDMLTTSEITCPYCGHKKTEAMPTDVCQLVYTCEKCKKDIRAKEGDCCVFCSYGTHKCPSMQDEKNG